MMGRILATVALAASVTACASPISGEPARNNTENTPLASSPTPPPSRNERGLIPKRLGEVAGLADVEGGPSVATFSIDKVTVDPPSGECRLKPVTGRTLVLSVRTATGDDQALAHELSFLLIPSNFYEIGEDGVRRQAEFGFCLDPAAALPETFGVNQNYAGQIEVVVPEASGRIALQCPGGGWEWTY